MEQRNLMRVVRRIRNTRFANPLWAIAPPLVASAGAPALLVGYTAAGAAGHPPPRIAVVDARILAVPAGAGATRAYFEIRNTGSSKDTLLYADSPELGISMLRRTANPSAWICPAGGPGGDGQGHPGAR
ncbi:copper chaperone PCu(A)C [Streptomyces sp. SID12501]|uniref:copper chaperone PCu(A)C n=1 Tax=Streptomyces sp. SID12501 TaxID=2706042 RepID=UPI001EF2BAA4|nr:copper chaperone PCu(A)C [Streptomyces sp. SID12501]